MVRSSDERIPLWVSRGQGGRSVESRPTQDTCTRTHEALLSGLEALTRIDDSSDDEPSMPTWKDEDSECEEVGRRADVRNVWARVGDLECHTAVDPGSLAGADECSSVRSESCWGEIEDIDEREDVDWRTEPQPTVLSHAVLAPQGVVSERVAHRVAHQGRSPVHVVRQSARESRSVTAGRTGTGSQCCSPGHCWRGPSSCAQPMWLRQMVAKNRVGKAPARFCPPWNRWILTSPNKKVQMTQPMWVCHSWKLVNLQDCVWEIHYQIIMKTILQEKVKIHYSTIIWFTSLFLCLKL